MKERFNIYLLANMNERIITVIKLICICFLITAVVTNPLYNYYVFLRWVIFLFSVFLVYNSRDFAKPTTIIFCVIAILFNPFTFFHFKKETWHIIDAVVAAVFFFSIDLKQLKASISTKGNLIFNLVISCFWGLVALVVALYFVFSLTGNPYNEYLLITKALTADGYITHSEEQEDVAEQEGHQSAQVFDVYYKYTFVTNDGKTIKGDAIQRRPKSGYLEEANKKPIHIIVEYIPNDPEIHRIRDMNTQAKTIFEFTWRRLGLGILILILLCSIGFSMIQNAIKEYTKGKIDLSK